MRGVYAHGATWRELPPWDRYLARVHAAASRYPGATFCLESAAVLLRMPVFGEPREVHIVGDAGVTTSRAVGGVRFHTHDRRRETTTVGAIVTTTPSETAVDIARHRHHAIGLATAGAALQVDAAASRSMLAALNEKRLSSRGRRHARWVIDRASVTPETPLEHLSLAVVEWLGFPSPESQVWFRGGDGIDDRVDMWWPQWRVAGEADGAVKYSGRWGDARDALRARNERDARLLRRGVRATAHWTWADAIAAEPLRASLIAAGLPIVAPPDPRELATLARALTPASAPAPAPAPAPASETATVHRDSER